MLDDFEAYCDGEYKDGIVKRHEMVIIACNKGEEEYLIEESDIPKITGTQKLNYFIRPENVLGYIDLETLNVFYNPEYIHNYTM